VNEVTGKFVTVICPQCRSKYRIPADRGKIEIKCRKCEYVFYWSEEDTHHEYKAPPKPVPPKRKSKKGLIIVAAIIAVVVIIGLAYYYFIYRERGRWITIHYGDLIDKTVLTRSGRPLNIVLMDSLRRGEAQPFVEKFSYLLHYAVDMNKGIDAQPQLNVVDAYPIGSPQPAWVAIFNSGRILVTTNYKGYARVYLPGKNPRNEYKKNYSIIRHCLGGLLSEDGSRLIVEVYTYKNNYTNSTLLLNLQSYKIATNGFPSPENRMPLDLAGLEEFFQKGGQLEGAKLDKQQGLLLFAKKGPDQTIAGNAVSLADLAVAYRAAFHAGDNSAYISLDKHKDPTKAAINFGGFLEDTYIGAAALEADKRFKTLGCGLDPNSYEDIRNYTRDSMPSFMTDAERAFLNQAPFDSTKYIGTHLWFYPGLIDVKTDTNYMYARIFKLQFMADAERVRDEADTLVQFKSKKASLPNFVQDNINDLNKHYEKYASAYREIQELEVVARLMGICSWLLQANADWLDLDALLSVDLPPRTTEREKERLMAVSHFTYISPKDILMDYVRDNTKIRLINPVLEESFSSFFKTTADLAKYMCRRDGVPYDSFKQYTSKAKELLDSLPDEQVKNIIKSDGDLKALIMFSANKIKAPLEGRLDYLEKRIKKLERLIGRTANYKRVATLANEQSKLVGQRDSLILKLKNLRHIMEIRGGIDLKPQYFGVTTKLWGPELRDFVNITEKTQADWADINGFGEWVTNSYTSPEGAEEIIEEITGKRADSLLEECLSVAPASEKGYTFYYYSALEGKWQYWCAVDTFDNSWLDLLKSDTATYRARKYDAASNTIHITEYQGIIVKDCIVGTVDSEGEITFKKAMQDTVMPTEPPDWWYKEPEEIDTLPAQVDSLPSDSLPVQMDSLPSESLPLQMDSVPSDSLPQEMEEIEELEPIESIPDSQ